MDNPWHKMFPQARAGDITPDEEPSTCAPCGLTFANWDLYHAHKVTHPNHRGKTCVVCSRDFNTAAACLTHRLQLHSQKQNLNCPACQMHFSRLGSLIHHLEQRLCGDSTDSKFLDRVRERNRFYENNLNVRNKSEYGATSGDFMTDTDQPIWRYTGPMAQTATSGDIADLATDQIVRSMGPTNLSTIIEPEGNRLEKSRIGCKPVDGKVITPAYHMTKPPVDEQPEFDGDAIISFDSPPRHSPLAHHTYDNAAAVSNPASIDWFSLSVGAANQVRPHENLEDPQQQVPEDLSFNERDFMALNQEKLLEKFDEIAYLRGAPSYMSIKDVRTSMLIAIANAGKVDQKGRYDYFMPVSRSPYVSNTTSKALAQPPKGPEKSSETLWSTPQYSWVKVATWGPGKSAFEVNTAFTERLEISLEEPIKPADISWGPGKSALEVNGVATQRLKNALFDESTDNSWGAGFDDNPWGSGSAKDSWASRVKVNKPDAIANFSFDPSESSFRAEAYWLEGLGKYKCPHKGCKKSFEKKMSFLTHLKSVVHMGVQERLQCRKCLDWFGSATALAQHAESQGLCILRDSDQYTRCVDEFTAGYAAPAGRHYDTSVRYVVNPVEKGNADPKTITARITEGQKALAAEKQKMDEKYWEVHQPKW